MLRNVTQNVENVIENVQNVTGNVQNVTENVQNATDNVQNVGPRAKAPPASPATMAPTLISCGKRSQATPSKQSAPLGQCLATLEKQSVPFDKSFMVELLFFILKTLIFDC